MGFPEASHCGPPLGERVKQGAVLGLLAEICSIPGCLWDHGDVDTAVEPE